MITTVDLRSKDPNLALALDDHPRASTHRDQPSIQERTATASYFLFLRTVVSFLPLRLKTNPQLLQSVPGSRGTCFGR